ncbi:MAG: NAD(P)H-dependent oxidoreductase subunit E [Desulfobacterales bacterium]
MKHAVQQHLSDITEKMWEEIDSTILENRDKPGSLITVLRECQNIVGYLPAELLDYIGKGLNIPGSKVFGVATFYSYFSLKPKGRNIIKLCMGTACYVKGIKEAMERIGNKYQIKEGETTGDKRFSLEAVRCLGACGLAPVMVVNQDIHGSISSDKVIDVLERYE